MEELYNKIGITTQAQPGTILLGIDANGNPLYGSPEAANDNTPNLAAKLAESYQRGLNQIGAASKEDNAHLDNLKQVVGDPKTIQTLDLHRAANDKTQFGKIIAKLIGGDTKNTSAAYDAWGVMSPNQKSATLLHVGGKADEYNNREYLPGVKVSTALSLQAQGIPMASVRGNWDQIDAIHTAIGHEGDATSAIKRAARSGQLGPVQALTQSDKDFYKITPAPQYGVGAMENPQGTQVPKGYTIAGNNQGKQIIVPQGNEASVAVNPKYNDSAGAIYSQWSEAGKRKATNGSQGGSNMYKSLTTLYDTNPKALGSAINMQIPGTAPFQDKIHGLAVKVLTTGDGNNSKPLSKDEALKKYGKSGIQNKEIGYKLANQAYAEGRINDSHLFAIQRSLDDAFNGDKALSHIAPPNQFDAGRFVGTPKPLVKPPSEDVGTAIAAVPSSKTSSTAELGDFNG